MAAEGRAVIALSQTCCLPCKQLTTSFSVLSARLGMDEKGDDRARKLTAARQDFYISYY
jgi:hypothetical protein